MYIVLIFILGLIIGSFLNVCIYRIPNNQSIVFPPSHCPSCGKGIKSYDLLPVISYFFLNGKCRYCFEKISVKYPLIELLTGILFILVYYYFGFTIIYLKYTLLLSLLIVVTFIDLEHSIIPGKLMIFSGVCGIVLNIIGYKSNAELLSYLYGFLAGGGVIMAIVLLTGGMGGGDIQLMAVIGLFLGFRYTLLILILSFIIGSLAGITLIILRKKTRKDYIPFGPWISVAALVAIFYGDPIINWYFSFF